MATRLLLLARHLSHSADSISDSELLARFAETRDNDAFAEIVRRHGPVVYRICRRLVGPATAEDAFQATFLVLATRLNAARAVESIGGWLVGVAGRVARQMRRSALRRNRYETAAATSEPMTFPSERPELTDQFRVLDEELARLPEKLRGPVVSCLLQGRKQEQIATELGQTARTLRRRLSEARRILRLRLMRRGVVPVVAAGLVAGMDAVSAAVPSRLDERTVAIVFDFLNGGAALASAPVILAKGVATAMFTRKVTQFIMVVVLGLTGLGFVLADGESKKPGPIPAANGEPPPTSALVKPPELPSPLPAPVPPIAGQSIPYSPASHTAEEVDQQLDWERSEAQIRDYQNRIKPSRLKSNEPSVVDRQILVDLACVRVPANFCKQAGLVSDEPNTGKDRPAEQFILSRREKRLLFALLRASPAKEFVARPTIVTLNDQAARFENNGREFELMTALEQSARDGQTVYIPKFERCRIWEGLTVRPKVAADGVSITLSIDVSDHIIHLPVALPAISATSPAESGAESHLPKVIPVREPSLRHSGFQTTVTVPRDGTAVIVGARETKSADGKGTDWLWILTPYVVEK